MSMIDRSFACTFFRSTVQLARGGGHAQGYNQSTGYFFGEKRVKEDWEPLFIYGFMGSMVFGTAVIYYKPDTYVHT
ncbi:MAG: hypothetical protein BYD32DRAFT_457208 [Podila humilis]|nr:MAG: hypothetical protein BYD32DRAFT_457208 [Podila humilis]